MEKRKDAYKPLLVSDLCTAIGFSSSKSCYSFRKYILVGLFTIIVSGKASFRSSDKPQLIEA